MANFIYFWITWGLFLPLVAVCQTELIPYRKGNKWGFCNQQKQIVIPCEYDEAGLFSESVAFVRKGKKWGAIDEKGKIIIKFEYDNVIIPFYNGVARLSINDQSIYIDKTGKKTTPPPFTSSYSNFENREQFNDYSEYLNKRFEKLQKDNKWAFKKINGNFITPFKYECVEDFYEGMAKVATYAQLIYFPERDETVKDCSLYGFIDTTGKEIIPCKYYFATDFKFGITAVLTCPDTITKNLDQYTKEQIIDNSKMKVIILNKKGVEIGQIPTKNGVVISEDSLIVTLDYGLYSLTGKEIVPPNKYDYFEFQQPSEKKYLIFQNGFVIVAKDNQKGVLSRNGQEILSCQYDEIFASKDFLFVKKKQKWGVCNYKGQEIIPCQYDDIGLIEENQVSHLLNDLNKYNNKIISKRGQILANLKHTKSFFWVKEKNAEGFIDIKGNKFWE